MRIKTTMTSKLYGMHPAALRCMRRDVRARILVQALYVWLFTVRLFAPRGKRFMRAFFYDFLHLELFFSIATTIIFHA